MVTSVSSSTASTTSSASSAATSSLGTTYETFLSLLTAQLKNQDPLSPMDSTEWTSQLVQYSSVEQQIKTNDYLSTLVAQSGGSLSSAVNYIGKSITADTNTTTLSGGVATWDYTLGSDASSVTVTVTDSDGNIVYKDSSAGTSAGKHEFGWDGTTSTGATADEGLYNLTIEALDGSGNAISHSVTVTGTVTSVSEEEGEVVLGVGTNKVALSDVTSVAS
ncbi:flagellar hook assembly protein FlgD [Asticcacaulis excentricus]|uniref:Basal-body rod modification protein FlgD n=1 Tax=Asticcacaulis excentricus (strain ATCC 15261 / DSM 4724 / KCTC 12464 / NCIMB 9791 / VKM B-1370 / CB 48) TaxID=573065 RepID=E8RPA2_ASTEC|nr:flagellar hook assembly protein FlgD [Asticcacaulis excentricus]ADU11948.1 flagellar hook capping protein [Asticcacaulis excentricus CB 48]